MTRTAHILLLALTIEGFLAAAPGDGDVVFRSDVALVRVDVQVVDRDNRAVTGLSAQDFILTDEGKRQEIRNFAREDMPVDVLFLLDVSASMRPHVERIASAAHQALRVLGDKDRIAIMVFDRQTRLRLPFRNSRDDVEKEFQNLLRHESFHGGTDITRGMLDAASYIGRQGRRDARRAIVILTDDETELERDDQRVSRALINANAVLSALIAPDAMQYGSYPPGMGRGRSRSGGTWPGGGGGGSWPGSVGGPLGGIILGRRGPYGGGGGPSGPVMTGPRTHSAGTSEIARQSGGDSMPVDDASALETTLSRIRQRYALHFHLPEGVKPGQERNIEVTLADAARRRYPDSEVRFRRVYLSPGGSGDASSTSVVPTEVTRTTRTPAPQDNNVSSETTAPSPATGTKRRAAISEPDGPRGANPSVGSGGSTAAETQPDSSPAPQTVTPGQAAPQADGPPAPRRGWRRVDEPEPAAPSNPDTTDQAPSPGNSRRGKSGQQ